MGYWDDKKPKTEDFASKEDIKAIREELKKLEKNTEPEKKESGGMKLVKGMGKGLGDIAKSLNSPESGRRMKIAQMTKGKNNPLRSTRVTSRVAGRNAGIKKHRIDDVPDRED